MAIEGRTPVLKKSHRLLLKREAEQRFRLRDAPLQPDDRPRLPSQGIVSATLGLQLTRLRREVPG
jgi:hypothetical protein